MNLCISLHEFTCCSFHFCFQTPPKTCPLTSFSYFNWERLIQSFCHHSYYYWWLQTESWLHSSGVIGNCRCEGAISMHKPSTENRSSPNGSMKNTYITLMLKRWMCIAATHWVQSLTGDILQRWRTGALRPQSVHSVCGSETQKEMWEGVRQSDKEHLIPSFNVRGMLVWDGCHVEVICVEAWLQI